MTEPPVNINHFQKHGHKVQCTLCPHQCFIHEGKYGICGVRRNLGGRIKSRNYEIVSGLAMDPIEKKPLYHFHPGSKILSIGSLGCNLKCNFCQNWKISQVSSPDEFDNELIQVSVLIDKITKTPDNIGVAFTYNEPTVWFEYMYDIASEAHKNGAITVMVTNGYINPQPLAQLLEVIDAFNVDLKAFDDVFYREISGGSLQPVLDSLKQINQSKKHLEITNLVISGKNDQTYKFTEMVQWIAGELGETTVLHLSRYFPRYKQNAEQTPLSTLEKTIRYCQETPKPCLPGQLWRNRTKHPLPKMRGTFN